MDNPTTNFVRAGSIEELKAKGHLTVRGPHRPILVVYEHERVFAFDNRCPHMGFPLDRGSVEDGILTCHWHHARFDLASGCTFDPWADDVPTCLVEVRDAEVWVKPTFGYPDPAAHWRGRLREGLAHNLGLVIAKAVQGELAAGVPPADAARQIVLFGARHSDGWGVGLTILTALGNLLPILPEEEIYLALFHGARRVAADCEGQTPRQERAPLASSPDLATLKRWLRRWTAVRHREAAERTLLTAIGAGASPAALAYLLLDAETDRTFAGGGHSLDFINKAFECLDLIGWEQAGDVLPTMVGQMVAARGAEESTSWRQPEDLVTLCQTTAAELPSLFAASRGRGRWSDHAALAHLLLGDNAVAIMAALKAAIRAGAAPTDLGRSLAYAAALRVARFGSANEHSDWETAHHVFTYANAVHRMLKRIDGADRDGHFEAVRGILHGAMALYLARYLNVPPARIPGDGGDERSNDLPAGNHENELGNGPIGYQAYQTYFSVPEAVGQTDVTRGLWYAFTAGSVRVISIANDDVAYQDGGNSYVRGYSSGAQRAWLENELSAARRDHGVDWVVVCMHQVAISTADMFNGADLGIREEWLPLFDRYGVDLVVCGHEHHYERSHPIRGRESNTTLTPIAAATATDVIDTSKGTVHMVIGGGGTSAPSNQLFFNPPRCRVITSVGEPDPATGKRAPVYVTEQAPWSAVRNAAHSYGFAAFTVDPGSHRGGITTIKVTYYDVVGLDGQLAPFENFTLSRPRRD